MDILFGHLRQRLMVCTPTIKRALAGTIQVGHRLSIKRVFFFCVQGGRMAEGKILCTLELDPVPSGV